MAVRLFNLRNVPDDEANEIRALLREHGIGFYETQAGGWGISVPAIWLHDDAGLDRAKALIDDYQRQRVIRMRAEFEQLRREGRHETVAGKILQHPLQAILLLMMILFVLYVSLSPFLHFGR